MKKILPTRPWTYPKTKAVGNINFLSHWLVYSMLVLWVGGLGYFQIFLSFILFSLASATLSFQPMPKRSSKIRSIAHSVGAESHVFCGKWRLNASSSFWELLMNVWINLIKKLFWRLQGFVPSEASQQLLKRTNSSMSDLFLLNGLFKVWRIASISRWDSSKKHNLSDKFILGSLKLRVKTPWQLENKMFFWDSCLPKNGKTASGGCLFHLPKGPRLWTWLV